MTTLPPTTINPIKRVFNITPSPPDSRDYKVEFPVELRTVLNPYTKEISTNAKVAPTIYSLSSYFTYVFDQGSLGSCTANAACQYYGFLLRKTSTPFSRLMQYWNTRNAENHIQYDSGATVRTTVSVLCKNGICEEINWPYIIKNFKIQPPATVCSKIISPPQTLRYISLSMTPSQWESALLAGQPIIFGMYVFSNFSNSQTAKTGIISYPTPSEKLLGGHCMLCTGYNQSSRQFEFLNSWGSKWGKNGYGYFPYSYLTSPYIINRTKVVLIFDAWIIVME